VWRERWRSSRHTPVSRRPGAGLVCVLAALVVALVSGCGSPQRDPAEDVAQAFYGFVADRDGAAACELLAPETRTELEQSSSKACSDALLSEQLPTVGQPRDVQVYGVMGEVRYDDETVFVTRFDSGWRVMAAACTPSTGGRYDCTIKGA
jgi:hypothetical protein